eukprot:GEMP01043075.1.p1 GENE.GEMP01043075.1~~GEMP01043075.1.p1  ORF type:complete len:345 (+),score=93.06 GEMP01043075.1:180-1214(+)
MELVMKEVYGDWDDPGVDFPKPMPATEAGPSADGKQRRYLWTDAFGVLNFITLAERTTTFRDKYLGCADKLVAAVHRCLGRPRSEQFPMLPNQRGEFKGLRIGKLRARLETDYGMEYDGMYWHYLDKWIFALARLARVKGELPTAAIALIKDVHPHFCARNSINTPVGMYWKMNCDLSPIVGADRVSPTNDALTAYVMYSSVVHSSELEHECRELKQIVSNYRLRETSDPLGYGLNWWEMQWLAGGASNKSRAVMSRMVHDILNPRHDAGDLAFRLYGAIIGAKLSKDSQVISVADAALDAVMEVEKRRPLGGPHSCINKVMFATALDPLAFERLADENVIDLG